MVTIHWVWLYALASSSAAFGWIMCALLTHKE